MARSMKLWLAVTVGACALVAIGLLPPKPVDPRPTARTERTEAERRQAELESAVQITREALRRWAWADSLVPLLVANAVDGTAVAVPAGSTEEREVTALASLVRADVAGTDPRDDAPLFGLVYQPYAHGRLDDGPVSALGRTEVLAGSMDGRAYCIQVRITDLGRVATHLRSRLGDEPSVSESGSTVGSCRPFLRHGLPGPAIERWLTEGALGLAEAAGEVPSLDAPWVGRRGPFGVNVFAGASLPLSVERCMAGFAEACGELVEHPELTVISERRNAIARRSPAVSVGLAGIGFRSWLPDYTYLLHDLEAEYGREAFHRFWTSDQPVDIAFERAFGEDLGTWTVRWIDGSVGIDRSGDPVPRSASTGALLLVLLLVGTAYLRERRRQVV